MKETAQEKETRALTLGKFLCHKRKFLCHKIIRVHTLHRKTQEVPIPYNPHSLHMTQEIPIPYNDAHTLHITIHIYYIRHRTYSGDVSCGLKI